MYDGTCTWLRRARAAMPGCGSCWLGRTLRLLGQSLKLLGQTLRLPAQTSGAYGTQWAHVELQEGINPLQRAPWPIPAPSLALGYRARVGPWGTISGMAMGIEPMGTHGGYGHQNIVKGTMDTTDTKGIRDTMDITDTKGTMNTMDTTGIVDTMDTTSICPWRPIPIPHGPMGAHGDIPSPYGAPWWPWGHSWSLWAQLYFSKLIRPPSSVSLPSWTGLAWTGLDRSGLDRPGLDRPVLDRPGLDKPGQARPVCPCRPLLAHCVAMQAILAPCVAMQSILVWPCRLFLPLCGHAGQACPPSGHAGLCIPTPHIPHPLGALIL